MSAPLVVVDLGQRPYRDVLELQRELCRRRQQGEITDDLLLLVEHNRVVTLGRGTRTGSLPLAPELLRQRGIDVVEVERGGDVTWHGPGQLVGYPIINLQQHRPDLHWYLRTLESSLVAALGRLGIGAEPRPGLTGVWTGGRKVASIGIHVKQWVTFHGFALNVINDLSDFELIVPCGIDGVVMTSVARELRSDDGLELWNRTREAVCSALGDALDRQPEPRPPEAILGRRVAAP